MQKESAAVNLLLIELQYKSEMNLCSNELPFDDVGISPERVEPLQGIDKMAERRNVAANKTRLTSGPGGASKALGIEVPHTGQSLKGSTIWIEGDGQEVSTKEIIASPRVGVDYAKEHAALPWRFRIKGNKWCSPAK